MPPIVAAAAVAAGGAIAGGAMQSRGASKAAQTQATAATDAARIEDEATKRAEAWQRQQAQQQWAAAEADRRANYDQWLARQQAMNAYRVKYGFTPVTLPNYVPSQDPQYTAAGTPVQPPEPPTRLAPEDGWRPPQRTPRQGPPPMGDVNAYLPSQRTAMQPYAPTAAGAELMPVDYYLKARVRR